MRSTVATVPVTVSVVNRNRSLLPCAADGRRYRLRAHLVGPPARLTRGVVPVMSVYIHDITTTGSFWGPRRFPRYDFVRRMAAAGHVAVVVDRLGYGASPHPDGMHTCLGAQADMVQQVVSAVRSGRYTSPTWHPKARRVALVGHSVGAGIAQLAAASFRGVHGLVLMSWSDLGVSQLAVSESEAQHRACALTLATGADRHYARFGRSRRVYRAMLFVTAPRRVQRWATRRWVPDPCGDAVTLAQLAAANTGAAHLVDVPVLLLFGERDALNRPEAADLHRSVYGPDVRVSTRTFTGTGNALPLERAAPGVRAAVSRWLCRWWPCR
ncbi:MAG: alpha/beta fold hydrolase [Nocardioidaceae bacterium]